MHSLYKRKIIEDFS